MLGCCVSHGAGWQRPAALLIIAVLVMKTLFPALYWLNAWMTHVFCYFLLWLVEGTFESGLVLQRWISGSFVHRPQGKVSMGSQSHLSYSQGTCLYTSLTYSPPQAQTFKNPIKPYIFHEKVSDCLGKKHKRLLWVPYFEGLFLLPTSQSHTSHIVTPLHSVSITGFNRDVRFDFHVRL